jgi:transposase
VEATYGWYWAVDALAGAGFAVTLAHPRGIASMQHRRAKTDQLDAKELADLLRIGRLASAWIAPPQVRELRELVRLSRPGFCAGSDSTEGWGHAGTEEVPERVA